MKRGKRENSFEAKLRSYSRVAASALMVAPAALSMTALMPSRGDAAVHYSGIRNIPVPVMNKYGTETSKYGSEIPYTAVDMDGYGGPELAFMGFGVNAYASSLSSSFAVRRHIQANFFFFLEPPTVGHINTQINTAKYNYGTHTMSVPRNLPSGYSIGSQANWDNEYDKYGLLDYNFKVTDSAHTTGSSFNPTYTFSYNLGNFTATTGYLGVRFESPSCSNGNYHYGWIRFSESADGSQGTIIDWAYEDQCNTPIHVQAQATTVPTLNQSGLLALVALLAGSGAVAMRRREEA